MEVSFAASDCESGGNGAGGGFAVLIVSSRFLVPGSQFNDSSDRISVLRGAVRGGSGEPAGTAASHQQRALVGGGDGVAGGGISVTGSGVCGGGAGDRVRRRGHGAVCLCHHAVERGRGRADQGKPCGLVVRSTGSAGGERVGGMG